MEECTSASSQDGIAGTGFEETEPASEPDMTGMLELSDQEF